MSSVVVVDYGMGNIKSVQHGLEHVGGDVLLSADPDLIAGADRLVLPGVGAFEEGMKGLVENDLDQAIHHFSDKGNPLLGICLGMQMLLDYSEEFGKHQGLGLIEGSVQNIPKCESGEFRRKIPHIGWSALTETEQNGWENSCLKGIEQGEFFYFVHSFMVVPEKDEHLLAQCEYSGITISAAVEKDNIMGVQFHPEKSSEIGLEVLSRFLEL